MDQERQNALTEAEAMKREKDGHLEWRGNIHQMRIHVLTHFEGVKTQPNHGLTLHVSSSLNGATLARNFRYIAIVQIALQTRKI